MKNADSNSFFISFLGVPAEPSTTARTQNGSWVVASPAASLSSWGVAIDGPFIGDLSIKKMVTFSSDMLNYRSVRTDTHGIQYIVRNAVMIHLVSPLLTKGFSKRGWSSITFFQHSVFYLAVLSGNMVTPISCGLPWFILSIKLPFYGFLWHHRSAVPSNQPTTNISLNWIKIRLARKEDTSLKTRKHWNCIAMVGYIFFSVDYIS